MLPKFLQKWFQKLFNNSLRLSFILLLCNIWLNLWINIIFILEMYTGYSTSDCFNFFFWSNHVHTGEKRDKSLTKQSQKMLTSNTQKEESDICKKQLIPQPQGRTETLSKSWLDIAAYSYQWCKEIQNRRKSVILLLWLQPVYGTGFLWRAPSPTENKLLSQAWQLMRRPVPKLT